MEDHNFIPPFIWTNGREWAGQGVKNHVTEPTAPPPPANYTHYSGASTKQASQPSVGTLNEKAPLCINCYSPQVGGCQETSPIHIQPTAVTLKGRPLKPQGGPTGGFLFKVDTLKAQGGSGSGPTVQRLVSQSIF